MCNSWIQFHLWSLTEKWQIKHHEAHRQPNFLKHGRSVNPCQGFAKVYILFSYKYHRYLFVDFKPFSLICQILGCGILKYVCSYVINRIGTMYIHTTRTIREIYFRFRSFLRVSALCTLTTNFFVKSQLSILDFHNVTIFSMNVAAVSKWGRWWSFRGVLGVHIHPGIWDFIKEDRRKNRQFFTISNLRFCSVIFRHVSFRHIHIQGYKRGL